MSTYLNKREILRDRAKPVATLCFLGRLYGNARFKKALFGTAKGVPTGWIAYAPVGEGRIAMDWVAEGTDGAVAVEPGQGEYTCECYFGPVLAEHPNLAVEPEWAFDIPFRVEAGRLILVLTEGDYRPSLPYERKVERWRKEARVDGGDPADHS